MEKRDRKTSSVFPSDIARACALQRIRTRFHVRQTPGRFPEKLIPRWELPVSASAAPPVSDPSFRRAESGGTGFMPGADVQLLFPLCSLGTLSTSAKHLVTNLHSRQGRVNLGDLEEAGPPLASLKSKRHW